MRRRKLGNIRNASKAWWQGDPATARGWRGYAAALTRRPWLLGRFVRNSWRRARAVYA